MRRLPDSPRPVYRALADDLRRRIRDGEYVEELPSARELSALYGLGKDPVRAALALLRIEGLVERAHGRPFQIRHQGDTIVQARPGAVLGARAATAQDAERHGVAEGEIVLVVEHGGEEYLHLAASTRIQVPPA